MSSDSKLVEIKRTVEVCRPPVTLTRQRRADSKTPLSHVFKSKTINLNVHLDTPILQHSGIAFIFVHNLLIHPVCKQSIVKLSEILCLRNLLKLYNSYFLVKYNSDLSTRLNDFMS
jgi:hypothetical protein